MDIAILIPIHNRLEITKVGLVSIKQALQKALPFAGQVKYPIIIIDDGSTDGSTAFIKENHPDVHVLNGDGNLWWSGAINVGAKYALEDLKVDFILLMNDDCLLDDDYFENMSKLIISGEADDKILASKVYYLSIPNKIFFYGIRFNFINGDVKIIGGGEIDNGQFNKPELCEFTGGMGVLIPKTVFDQIGYFDAKNFPQYYGDADFTLRASRAGIKIYCRPDLKLWNDRQATGFSHNGKLSKYFRSLFSIRSSFNIIQDYKFYSKFLPFRPKLKRIGRKHSIYFYGLLKRKARDLRSSLGTLKSKNTK